MYFGIFTNVRMEHAFYDQTESMPKSINKILMQAS